MSVYTSSSSTDHIRNLLHQRTTPSHPHTHFAAPAELLPDSPSVYSRSQFTPRPQFDSSSRSTLDDDGRGSFVSASSVYDHDGSSPYVSDYCTEEDDEPEHRMSMLGIKMRVHSKAPWETGEDDIVEEEEADSASVYRPPSSSKRSLKSFGRPSTDSSRSSSAGKKSFETSSSQMSSRGALQALAQASMSSSSLSLPPVPGQSAIRQKLSLPRLRTRTTSNSNGSYTPPLPYSNIVESPRSAVFSTSPTSQTRPSSPTRSDYSQSHLDTRSIISRSPSPIGHPYANPELVRSAHGYEHHKSKSQGQDSFILSSNDSLVTLMSSEPTTSSLDTYAPSTAPSSPVSGFKSRTRGKQISGPIPLGSSALRPRDTNAGGNRRETRIFPITTVPGILGWQEPQSSAFTLISLEEARAQRGRNGAADSGSPDSDQAPSPVILRPRVRSTSAAGRTRNAAESIRSNISIGNAERANSDVPGKSLKHKKSGFMRIFAKERDRTPTMPSPPHSGFPAVIPPVPRTAKVSTHRVPVPPLSPHLIADIDISAESSDSHESGTVNEHTVDRSPNIPSPKRIMPALSINTSASTKRLFGNAASSTALQPPNAPFASVADQPQSAPPGKTDFLGLKLRPVSTMFSSHFSDHILDPESAISERGSQPSLELDTGTPTTVNASPRSPDFPVRTLPRSQSGKLNPDITSDDQSDIVRALQAQISGAQQAWQKHVWELEGQVRDLKAEIEELKHVDGGGEYCNSCGRGHRRATRDEFKGIHRPRAQTGNSGRFVSTLDS